MKTPNGVKDYRGLIAGVPRDLKASVASVAVFVSSKLDVRIEQWEIGVCTVRCGLAGCPQRNVFFFGGGLLMELKW